MSDTPKEWRLKLYRGWWYATRRAASTTTPGKFETVRRSLRTTDRTVAQQRLEDVRTQTSQSPADVRGIVSAYQAAHAHQRSATRNGYAWAALESTFAHLRDDQISRAMCTAYAEKRRRAGVSNGTIRKELEMLRAAVNWANPKNTAVFLLPPADAKDRYLTHDEFNRLMDHAGAFHMKVFMALALATAARKEALLTLTWDRVDIERGIINLGRGNRQKGRAVVPVNSFLKPWLRQAKEAAVSDYVIEWGGGPVASIRKGFERACARAGGLDDVTPHTLRHTAAVWMAEAGVPMSEIAQYLGHRDTRTTERIYARYSPDYLQGAASALNPHRA